MVFVYALFSIEFLFNGDVDESASYVSASEQFFDADCIFCFIIFYGGLPTVKGVKGCQQCILRVPTVLLS